MKPVSPWKVPGRIAYIVNHSYPYSTNGYAVRTHGVAKGLVELGHSVVVIARPGYPWDLPGMADHGKEFSRVIDGVRYLFLSMPARTAGSNEDWFEGATASLKEVFGVFKPSTVMAASNWENAIPAQRAAKSLDLPFVYEVRGFWEISRASRDHGFEHSAEYAHIVEQETAVASSATVVVTINRFMQDELVRRGIEREKLCLLPNGIDRLPSLDGRMSLMKSDLDIRSKYLVGYIGSFTEYEGIEDLIAAVAELVKADVDVSLLLVGSSNAVGLLDAECSKSHAYRELAAKLGISGRVLIVGRQTPEAVRDYYRLVDAIVIPRRPYQVSHLVAPIKPVEAAAWGKCVLLSDVSALMDFQAYIPGFSYFKAGDSGDLARSLHALLSDDRQRQELSLKNRNAASALTWAANAANLSKKLKPKSKDEITPVEPAPLRIPTLAWDHDDNIVFLTDEPKWHSFAIDETDFVKLYGTIQYEIGAKQSNGKALLVVEYYDQNGQIIAGPYPMFRRSDAVGWFNYLKPMVSGVLAALRPPIGTKSARIGLRTFHAGNSPVSVTNRIKLLWHDNQIRPEFSTTPRQIVALPFEGTAPKTTPRLKVASIFDPFSHACFAPECDLISITPSDWREQLLGQKVDMILVESAWHGNNDSWLYRIASYRSPPGNELKEVLQWAKKFDIPTVFWNKEDPPNFDRFIDRAADFDYIFTTDANCIERYRQRVPKSTYVGALPFAAQTDIHNPYLDLPRLNATSFAGTYYADDFEARRNAMDMLLRISSQYGLDIFDRMFSVTGEEKKRFLFPADLQPFIRGSLNYTEMLAAYRRYRLALNVNSVADSPTMFSRRVFELLACGTPVVSTASQGIDAMFHGLVPTVDTEAEAQEALGSLMRSGIEWQRASVRGIRAVFAKHTYKHRLDQMAKTVGLATHVSQAAPVVVVTPNGDAHAFAECIANQRTRPDEVVLSKNGFSAELVSAHAIALKAIGIRVAEMPRENIASYIRSRHARSVVALCESKHYYGPNYLTDALYSVVASSSVVSTILPVDNVNGHFTSGSFQPFAAVGTTSNSAFAGTLIVSATSPLLNQVLSLKSQGHIEVPFSARQRAWFEFLPAGAPGYVDRHIVNLD